VPVLELTADVDELAWRTAAVAEVAVVEHQHREPCSNERTCEGDEPATARSAEAVRHHHAGDRPGVAHFLSPCTTVGSGRPNKRGGALLCPRGEAGLPLFYSAADCAGIDLAPAALPAT